MAENVKTLQRAGFYTKNNFPDKKNIFEVHADGKVRPLKLATKKSVK